jgi:RNA polymerase sigma factor (sigma-70 family)
VNSRRPSTSLGAASEPAVAALAISGDDGAFGELVRRRQSAVRNLLRRLTRDAALADDLAQQAFLLAWKSIRSLRSPHAFGPWMRKLAINCWLQHSRARRHEAMRDESAPGDADRADYPEDPAVPKIAERMDLDAALARLPAHVRLCVVLAYSEGMSHSEISESTDLPLGTVKSHITRGAARLREWLHAYGEAHDR